MSERAVVQPTVPPAGADLPALAAVRPVFRDPALEAQFRELGFAIVELVGAAELDRLRSVVDSLLPDVEGFHSSLQSSDVAYRQAVFEHVPPVVADAVGGVLSDYEPFAASLTVKGTGAAGHLDSHQDWSMVDEDRYRGINVWIPLEGSTVANGTLRVLPRSHRALDHLRCSPCNPASFESEQNLVPVDVLVPLTLLPGQAVVFDQGLLHGSGPNLSEAWRPAVTVAYRPAEAELLHHFVADPSVDEVELFHADPSFFTELVIGERPKMPAHGVRPFHGTRWTRDGLVTACIGADAVGTDEAGAEAKGPRAQASIDPGHDIAPTLRDPELQRRFAEDGYVVIDLLTPAEVARFDELVDEVFTGEAAGFHATNMLPSPEYRQTVWREVRPTLGPKVLPFFDDYEPCTAALMIKFPDEGSGFIAHQDWSLVDERRYRSVNVWVPLIDASEANGGLRVLPGSHRALHAVRCSPAPPQSYDPPGWQVSLQDLELLDVRAGQAVIFDHAILHGSEPNRSDHPRRAVTIALKPRTAQLYHWHLPDPAGDVVRQYAIDADYLADFVLGVEPPYPLVAEMGFEPDTISPAELVGREPAEAPVVVSPVEHAIADVTVLHDAPVRLVPSSEIVDHDPRWGSLPSGILDLTRPVRRTLRRLRSAGRRASR